MIYLTPTFSVPTFSASPNYSIHEQEYKHGRKVEELIVSVLKSLDEIKVWRTHDNSQADCQFKWDVIIEVKGLLFALQVKSSKEGMQDFEVDKEDTPVSPVVIWASLNCDQKEMRRKFASWFNLEIKDQEMDEEQNILPSNDLRQSAREAHLRRKRSQGWNPELEKKLQAKRNESAQRRRILRRNYSDKKELDDWQPE